MSFQSHEISIEEHTTWFKRQLQSDNPFYIAYYGTLPFGYARFDGNKKDVVVSVAVDSAFRGRGLGTTLITSACHKVLSEWPISCIHAYIKTINTISVSAFLKACFVISDCMSNNSDSIHLEYPGYAELL
jgi:RimJ/RimL family protein N-acetyltransferase